MKIVDFSVYRFDLPLTSALPGDAGGELRRRGLIVSLKDAGGVVGFGEISPLPGFSREDLATARGDAFQVLADIVDQSLAVDVADAEGVAEFWRAHRAAPSVRCGVEQAFVSIAAQVDRVPFSARLSSTPRGTVSLCGLLSGDSEAVIRKAETLLGDGFMALKMKVGVGDPRREAETVLRLRRTVGDAVQLRLDANRSWDLTTAIDFGRRVRAARVHFVEEPLRDPALFREFHQATGLLVGLDETLREDPDGLASNAPTAMAAVIKPMLTGGYGEALALARAAANLGLEVVISSSFESGVGLVGLAHLAAAVNMRDVAAGLDTATWFGADILPRSVSQGGGLCRLETLPNVASDLQIDSLELVVG